MTTILNPTDIAPAALSTPKSEIEMELAHSEETQKILIAKSDINVTKILFLCIFSGVDEQKKSVAVIFLDFQQKAGMHIKKICEDPDLPQPEKPPAYHFEVIVQGMVFDNR